MIESLKAYWAARVPREKWLLGFAGLLALIVFAWLLVIRPLGAALDAAQARHDAAVLMLGRVEARAAQVAAFDAAPPPALDGRVMDVVMAEALAAGFNTASPEGVGTDGVRIAIGAVRPQTFFAWVADLEDRLGLEVVSMTARPNSDETLSVDVVFRRGRAG